MKSRSRITVNDRGIENAPQKPVYSSFIELKEILK
jgi:hypothetical protein